MTALKPGVQAPDFSLLATPDQKVSLSDFRGQPVVLVFSPADWSPVCSDQLALYNELMPEFSECKAQIIGISVDGVWCHLAFSQNRKLHFPLLADFEPKGAVARQYGVYREAFAEEVGKKAAVCVQKLPSDPGTPLCPEMHNVYGEMIASLHNA